MKEMINDREKRWVLKRFRKTVSVGADVTSDGRLFQRQHSATEMHNHRQWTAVYVESLAAWTTMTRDVGCGQKDTVVALVCLLHHDK